MKLLLYCVKAKPYLADFKGEYQTYSNGKELDELWDKGFNLNDIMNILNGKIVAECDFEVEEIEAIYYGKNVYDLHHSFYRIQDDEEWLNKTCLNMSQLDNYLKGKNGYGIHIKNLHIFDKPKELSKCYYLTLEKGFLRQIKKAPQNMCYALTTRDDKDILISIRPEWLCKILNKEKTIEIRKKVLKEML